MTSLSGADTRHDVDPRLKSRKVAKRHHEQTLGEGGVTFRVALWQASETGWVGSDVEPAITGQVTPVNPAAAVRGPKLVVKTGKTPNAASST